MDLRNKVEELAFAAHNHSMVIFAEPLFIGTEQLIHMSTIEDAKEELARYSTEAIVEAVTTYLNETGV